MIDCLRNFKLHVEVLYTLLGFSIMFENSITTNFLLYRTCYVTLEYNRSDCDLLGTKYANNDTKIMETKVETYGTYIIMCRSITEAFIAPLFGFLLASWSDKNGRRPLMLFGLTGLLMSYLIMTIVSSLPYISPWYFLLHEIPFCLCGSKIALMTACLSYMSDTIPEHKRGIRLGFLEAAANLGMLVGTSSSSYVFTLFGYSTIYLTCVACQFFSWMFTWFFINDSLHVDENQRQWRTLFRLTPIKETMAIVFKRRENSDRAIVLCIFAVFVIFIGAKYSDSSILFLYLRGEFTWTLEMYTLFVTFSLAVWILMCLVTIRVFVNILRMKETTAIIMALTFNIMGYSVQGFANKNWQIYGAAGLLSMGSCIPPLSHLLLSKVVPKDEIGKLFAALVSFNSISLLLGSTFNAYVYNQTILRFPQGFNFVTAVICGFSLIVAIVLSILYSNRETSRFHTLTNEEDTRNE